MLEYVGVAAGYAEVPVVSDVSVATSKGTITCLIGTNGAGKTTFLRSCVGLVARLAGEIRLDGEVLAARDPAQMLKSGIALVPEGRGILSGLTVRENLLVGAFTLADSTQASEQLENVYTMFPTPQGAGADQRGSA